MSARPMRTSRLFDALPPYLGGKRRLVPLILADLAAELPAAEWPGASFCDPMCGGGAVALAAKAQGFEVYASDRARRGAIRRGCPHRQLLRSTAGGGLAADAAPG